MTQLGVQMVLSGSSRIDSVCGECPSVGRVLVAPYGEAFEATSSQNENDIRLVSRRERLCDTGDKKSSQVTDMFHGGSAGVNFASIASALRGRIL